MVKILILEDNFSQAESLSVALIDMGYEVVGAVSTGAKALKIFREQQPDLAILDIKVRGNMDGIDVGKVIFAERAIPIIYLTAYDDEFERTKSTHPAAFFSKPYNPVDFSRAISLAIHKFEDERKENVEIEKSFKNQELTNLFFASDYIWIKPGAGQAFAKILLQEIMWFKADNVYLDIVTRSGDKDLKVCLPMSKLLDGMTNLKGHYHRFVQINRSYLVNINYITRFTKEKVWMEGEQVISIGKKFLPELMSRLKDPVVH